MRRDEKLPELLAPAGNMEALYAAILGGADAVYVGGLRFGARAYAKNFTDEELRAATRLCHIHGVRIYVTLNTLILDKEMTEAVEYARSLYEMGVDALIVADLGVVKKIRREVPFLELHASTQMGAHNSEGVNFAASLGCSRVVLARECSWADISEIVEKSNAECEVFLHGALCVCHSGQCLFSSLVGGRSGNRGECAQPCRLPYNNGKYPLSLSDLSLSEHIGELIDSGVSSLKIEGRMKSADYVYEVTRIYRTLLDEARSSNKNERKKLADIFSRDGFTDGYFTGQIFLKMTGVRSEEEKKISKELSGGRYEPPKLKIKAEAEFLRGKKSSLTLTAKAVSRWDNAGVKIEERTEKEIFVTVFGDVPNEAENAPLTESGLKARLAKMGNTPFSLNTSDILLSLDDGINLSPSAVNALRREAAIKLEEAFAFPIKKTFEIDAENAHVPHLALETTADLPNKPNDKKIRTSALFFNRVRLEGVYEKNPELLFGIEAAFVPLFEYKELSEKLRESINGVYIPPVIMEREWELVKEEVKCAAELGARYALIGNISHVALISETSLIPVGDFRLNVTNRESHKLWSCLGVKNIILSPELTLPQARDVGGGMITLGRIPLMLTERCFVKENFGCDKCGKAAFTDRKGAKFPILREYKDRNIIFNSSPTYMGDKTAEIRSAGISHTHFIFSVEQIGEIINLMRSYRSGAPLASPHRRIGKR